VCNFRDHHKSANLELGQSIQQTETLLIETGIYKGSKIFFGYRGYNTLLEQLNFALLTFEGGGGTENMKDTDPCLGSFGGVRAKSEYSSMNISH
jgi:hypothetical protein